VVHQTNQNWQRLGSVEDLKRRDLQQLEVDHTPIALSYRNGEFGAVSGRCNHAGGPLGQGTLRDDYIVCPWHNWMFHRLTGKAQPEIPAAVRGTPCAFRIAISMSTSQPLPGGFMHRMPSTR
jgi:nitrite reductase/ring-hydroxylating ferredoxin subunit